MKEKSYLCHMNNKKVADNSTKHRHKNEQSTLHYEAGKFCLDIAKLVFAGVILVGLMKQDMEFSIQFSLGLFAVGVFCFYGFLLIYSSKK